MRFDEARLPVAEMELAFGKAERRPKKSRHRMHMAGLISQALPQNHVAAAFALRGRRQRAGCNACQHFGLPRASQNGAGIGMFLDKPRDPIEQPVEPSGLPRLHEAEMALRQIDFFIAWQGPQDWHSDRLDGSG